MRYELQHMDTESGVGVFAALPGPNLSYAEMLAHLRGHPYDSFMHGHLLRNFGEQRARKVEKVVAELERDLGGDRNPADLDQDALTLAALVMEACLTHERLHPLLPRLEALSLDEPLAARSPSVALRARLQINRAAHRSWIERFSENISWHVPLPTPAEAEATGLPPLFAQDALDLPPATHVADVRARLEAEGRIPAPCPRRPLAETIATATERLEALNCLVGPEMRHKASLSPINLQRMWMFKVSVSNGRHADSLSGLQTSYGRGFEMESARASCLMEVVERVSSYAGVGNSGITARKKSAPLIQGSFAEVSADARALDPSTLRLEAPYAGQRLWWMDGEVRDADGAHPCLLPPQLAYLFMNLDEQSLFSGLGSTGLASGNTMEEARLSGLCEVLERDACAVQPFDRSRCFQLETDDPEVAKLLEDYTACGIHVWFQDLTQETGIPCYKAFVTGVRGDVNSGTGCGLSGRRAIVSGMTETFYPFPGPPSAPAPEGLPARRLEDLPDHSTGSAAGDLLVVEETLIACGYTPHYADMTRKELDLPVCRAIVPGLEIVSDFDRFSRVSPRLFRNYLRMFE